RRYSSNAGLERARRHIEEADALSQELGGTDKDVKEYFFALPPRELVGVLEEYGRQFGDKAKEYAIETIPRWKSGGRRMSGLVAGRLFKLLPPRMPLDAKYRLTESLWRHVGPSSKKRLRVGLDASVDDVVEAARTHIEDVVVRYTIPSSLEQRFAW